MKLKSVVRIMIKQELVIYWIWMLKVETALTRKNFLIFSSNHYFFPNLFFLTNRLDATNFGNIARFFNHSCEPNLEIFRVYVDVLDSSRPKIALFTKRDVLPGEELTFDYKYDVKKLKLRCRCGSANCKKWLM